MLGYARVLNEARGDLVENPLGVGDLVQLRSGGSVMVVSQIDEASGGKFVGCCWHDRTGVVREENFSPQLLRRARGFFGRRR